MPYRPFSPAAVDRSYAYKKEWFSAVCSVACLLAMTFHAGYLFQWARDDLGAFEAS